MGIGVCTQVTDVVLIPRIRHETKSAIDTRAVNIFNSALIFEVSGWEFGFNNG